MSPLAWCHQCEVGGRLGACWVCGDGMVAFRPEWMAGRQMLPAERQSVAHPRGALVGELVDAGDQAA